MKKIITLLTLTVLLWVEIVTPMGYAIWEADNMVRIPEETIASSWTNLDNTVENPSEIIASPWFNTGSENTNSGDITNNLDSSVESPENNEKTTNDETEIIDNANSDTSNITDESPGNESEESSTKINIDTENNTDSESLIDNTLFTGENLSKENEELMIQATDAGNNIHELSTFQKAFQEVAYAYYMRGPYLHYNSAKGRGRDFSPEEATSQDYDYLACGLYVLNVYRQLLDKELLGNIITFPYAWGQKQYAKEFVGKRPEVIGYGELSGNNLYWSGRLENGTIIGIVNPNKEQIISQLKIGDILGYDGHVMMVYDFKYDENWNIEDVYLIHSTDKNNYRVDSKIHVENTVYDSLENKRDLGFGHNKWSVIRYNNFDRRTKTGFVHHSGTRVEWTISLETMTEAISEGRNVLEFNIDTGYSSYYFILRFVTTDGSWNSLLNIDGTLTGYQETSGGTYIYNSELINYSDSIQSRLKYNKLYIEKTVDKWDNSVVWVDDELTYTIKIQNNSNKAYTWDLIVKEYIDSNLVEYIWTSRNDIEIYGNQLKWNIGKLNNGAEVIIEYTVRVKEWNIGKTIETIGLVDNIPSGTIRNKIGKNTNKGENLKDSYNNKKGEFTGKKLINEIYKEVYGVDLELDNILKINTTSTSYTWALIYFNNRWWNRTTNWDNVKMQINQKSPYSGMILNGYFNVLCKANQNGLAYNGSSNIEIPRYLFPAIAVKSNDPDKRANTIFPSNFMTGDILIYRNSNDIYYTWKWTPQTGTLVSHFNTYENGEYIYIYIDGKFVGVNLWNDGLTGTSDDRNEFTTDYYTNMGKTGKDLRLYTKSSSPTSVSQIDMPDGFENWLQYQTLFGKEAYVILRPSLMIRSLNYELDGWTNSMDNPNEFILRRDNVLKEPTKSGYTFNGRYTDSGCTNQVNNTSELTDDAVLYAKWEKNLEEENNPSDWWENKWANNYSGWWWRWWSNNSRTDSNTNSNQHWSADENQQKIEESKPQSNTEDRAKKTVENSTKINEITVKQTVISNNPNYTKEFNEAYSFAKSNWITTTYSIEKAKMNTNIIRIQMAKMLSNFAINVLWKEPDVSKWIIRFNDVTNKMNKDYNNAVTLAYQLGIMWINVKSNNFRPNDEVTRAEFVTALSRMLYWIQDWIWKTKYYEPHMKKLYNEWIINNTNPKLKEKRWYVMIMLMRSIKQIH